jgi:hypothetical protein
MSQAMMVVVLLSLVGCKGKTETTVPTYSSPAAALKDYDSYLYRVSGTKNATTKELISLVQEWKTIDDAVAATFFANAYTDDATDSDSCYVSKREQVIDGFVRLVDTRKRTFSDYLDVVTAIRTIRPDTATQSLTESVHRFYASMDKTPTYKGSSAAIIRRYEQTLSDALDNGIRTKPEVFTFLRAEDRAFRSFLEHLSTMGTLQLTKVRDNTSLVLKQVVELSDEKVEVFTPKEMMTILTMRNNRRLLQNALQCVNDIRSGKVGKNEQSAAYLWMLLQPWVSFDAHAFSLMSEAQLKTLRILATETPRCIDRLGNPDFPLDPDELPALLMKTYISTL